MFYYHPDHLGSSSYITDVNGEVSQHIEYFAFGETFVEEHSNTGATPYKFNAKELDDETGLYYYGARYFDPKTSVWASVDPLADKMPSWSPYSYSFNNPVKFVDEDGRIPILPLLIKAGANAAADWFMQTAMNYYFNPSTAGNWSKSAEDVNGWQIARSGFEGLIPWRTPGGRLGKAALSAIGDVTVNYFNDMDGYSDKQALQDFAVGFVGDLAGGGIGELVSKYGLKNVARGLSRMGFDDKKIEEILTGFGTTWKGKVDYSDIPDPRNAGAGKKFTQNQKAKIFQKNQKANNGYLRSDEDGTFLNRSKKGGSDPNGSEVDHITARSRGGSNSNRNAQVLSKRQNRIKSNR